MRRGGERRRGIALDNGRIAQCCRVVFSRECENLGGGGSRTGRSGDRREGESEIEERERER